MKLQALISKCLSREPELEVQVVAGECPPADPVGAPANRVVDLPSKVGAACQHLAQFKAIGASVTWAPVSLASPRRAPSKVWRLELAAGDGRVFCFDLLRLGVMPPDLRNLLGRVQAVGVGLADVAAALLRGHQVELGAPVDVSVGTVLADGYRAGVADIPLETLIRQYQDRHIRHASKAVAALQLLPRVREAVAAAGVENAWELENRLIAPLAALQVAGLHVDRAGLEAQAQVLDQQVSAAQAEAHGLLGGINLDDPVQLRAALNEKVGLKLQSTREADLAAALHGSALLRHLLAYRTALNLQRACLGLLKHVGVDDRIRARFQSLGAPTGRMSCSAPNLQGVPGGLRRFVVAPPGKVLVVADYSAIELRVIAELVQDPELLRCFQEGGDPHRRTAAFILSKSEDQVTRDERQAAKAVNFGFCFGMGIPRFIQNARDSYGVEFSEATAADAQGRYFQLYRGIDDWHRRVRADKPLETRAASGRLRRFKDFSFTEALNSPVQGTAADGMKLALVLLHEDLKRLGAQVVNVIHDEVVVEASEDCAQQVMAVVVDDLKQGMGVLLPSVPVEVEARVTGAWEK